MMKGTSQRRHFVCPSCGSVGMDLFYEVRQIPVHSAIVVPDRATAMSFPRGDLVLGFCQACGFIANTAFDSTAQDYSLPYEASQACSTTFNKFAETLVRRLIDRYGIRGQRVLEIGCGTGEFIALLCEWGMNKGIGIDPAYMPGRLSGDGVARVEFIREPYDEKHSTLEVDLICCRHTLEHIGPVGKFVQQLRKNIGDRFGTLVFFEVPDTYRILMQGAFWDLYYEHCSYFTAGSLARLFRRSGFDVIDLRLEYDAQYITLLAKPSEGSTQALLEIEDDVPKLECAVKRFQAEYQRVSAAWSATLAGLRRQGKRVALWGSGSKAVAFLTTLQLTDQIDVVVDINPHKQNKHMPGVSPPIVAPTSLKESPPDCVIVMNPIYLDEIKADLRHMGLTPRVLTL